MGRFIVVEGMDGAGTTTQAELLSERLERSSTRSVVRTREPTDEKIGRRIRRRLQELNASSSREEWAALALNFSLDRLEHWERQIRPSLESGQFVVSDRYQMSSWVYQGLHLSREWIEEANSFAGHADVNVVITLSPEVATERRIERSRQAGQVSKTDIFEHQEFQSAIAEGYERAILRWRKLGRSVVEVDGAQSVEGVHQALWSKLAALGVVP